MTTNLAAIAGPSRQFPPNAKVELPSPLNSIEGTPSDGNDSRPTVSVSKPGLSVGENGEVVKVPAFLNKLFSMVSDSDTDSLIYWAESGDSFFVPNHECFAKELLPRFFKHGNFSSFVRQLNMYGFHKVPHLQSGVLKNESPTELWEFVNPFFKRDQPQLLSRVTRKNNRPTPSSSSAPSQGSTGTRSSARQAAANAQIGNNYHVPLLTDGTVEGEAGPLVGPAAQLADLHAIQSGINAIRQTQAAIGADLKALQASNEHLWREALESRERQQKHEETIDLIVSFLERLFGTEGEGLKGLKEAMRRGGMGGTGGTRKREDSSNGEESVAQKRRRLMIEDAHSKGDEDTAARLVEIQEPSVESAASSTEGQSDRSNTAEPWNSTGPRFASLPTDEDGVSPHTTTHSRSNSITRPPSGNGNMRPGGMHGMTAGDANGHHHHHQQQPQPHQYPQAPPPPHPQHMQQPPPQYQADDHLKAHDANSLAPYGSHVLDGSDSSGLNLDPHLLQTTIGSLLQSPAAAQMFLNSLNSSVQGQSLSTPSKVPPSPNGPNPNDPTMALFSPLPHELVNNTNNLMGAYKQAAGVGGDVEKLQESIDSLVRSMGLDVPDGTSSGTATGASSSVPTANAHGVQPDPSLPSEGTFDDGEFNVDDLLDQLAKNNADDGDDL